MTTDTDNEIAALKKKIKGAEGKIEQVEAALEAYASPYFSQRRSDAFQRAGPYGGVWWSVGGLQAELGRLRDDLTAKENLLLEARRAERASRDSNVAAVMMFSIKAEFEVAPTTPVHWFRSLLAKKLGELKPGIVVYGSCERDGVRISVDFLASSLDNRAAVVTVLSDLAKTQCDGKLLSTSFSAISEQLRNTSVVPVTDLSSVREWKYAQNANGSPDAKFKRDRHFLKNPPQEVLSLFKRQKSDGSSVSATAMQNAHVLWEQAAKDKKEKATTTQIRTLITECKLSCRGSVEDEMKKLQSLTWPYPYEYHQLYDKVVFYFRWSFQRRGGPDAGWDLHGIPVFIDDFDSNPQPGPMYIPNIPDSTWLTWQRALALRKAITCITRLEQFSPEHLKVEWDGQNSAGNKIMRAMCWENDESAMQQQDDVEV